MRKLGKDTQIVEGPTINERIVEVDRVRELTNNVKHVEQEIQVIESLRAKGSSNLQNR